jgi:hypothetical protein
MAAFIFVWVFQPRHLHWPLLAIGAMLGAHFLRRPFGSSVNRAPVFLRKLLCSLPFAIVGVMFVALLKEYGLVAGWIVNVGNIVLIAAFTPVILWIVYDDYLVFTGRASPWTAQQ